VHELVKTSLRVHRNKKGWGALSWHISSQNIVRSKSFSSLLT